MSVNPDIVRSLLEMSKPETVADIQQFIAASNWIRGRIPEYATIVAPFQNLMQVALVGIRLADAGWDEVHEKAFGRTRNAIAAEVTVEHPDPSKCFCLYTDASSEHWASVLTQITDEELQLLIKEQAHEPLLFRSGTFREAQVRWAIPDKEGGRSDSKRVLR